MENQSNRRSKIKRSEQRHSRAVIAQLKVPGGEFENISIQDFSSTGFRGKAVDTPSAGDKVELKFANQEIVSGIVKWVQGLTFGVKLDDTIDIERFTTE